MKTSVFYQDIRGIPLASWAEIRGRTQIFDLFMRVMRPNSETTVLDIGVTCEQKAPGANLFERLYPYKNQLTVAGVEDASHLEHLYPGMRFVAIAPGQPLPFADQSFDIVFSNAVVEHVGSREAQQAFITELCRVGRAVFIAVPNRFFPVEHHTGMPLVQWLPDPAFRTALRLLGRGFWAETANLNHFFPWEFRRFFPSGRAFRFHFCGIGLGWFRSNYIACTTEEAP